MDPSIYLWVRIAHIIGIVLWVGGLLAVLSLLRVHTQVDGVARESLTRVEKTTAMVMDLGATLAIATGLYMALKGAKFPNTAFASGGWFHIKLTLVVLGPFALHGLARAKIKKFARGQLKPLPPWVVPVLILAVIGIVVMAGHPTLLRK
jgi:protoporphyrinogen IX oxidase